MRKMNQFMVHKHFKMEGTPILEDLFPKNDFAISFDLKEDYNHISVHPTLQDPLGIQYMGTAYIYRGMPFDPSDDSRVFTQIMKKCVMAISEIWPIHCVIYLDDLLLLHPSKDYLEKIAPQITQFLCYYSWTVNFEKSHLKPSQQFQYLGWIWNSTMTVQLPSESPKQVKISKKESIQEKSNTSEDTGKINWNAFHNQNSIPQSVFLSQMFIQLSSLPSEQGRIGHMDTMVLSNISRTPLVEPNNKREYSSFNPETSTTSSGNNNRCSPMLLGCNSPTSQR
jgi:hypothetical protein